MMPVDTLVQLASLSVYAATLIWGGLAFRDVACSEHPRSVRYIAFGLVTLSMMTAAIFIVVQWTWIVQQQWKILSLAETLGWLMYDWLNGLTHLAIILAVRAFMRWEQPRPCQATGVCPAHQLARREREQDREIDGIATGIEALQQRIDKLSETMTRDD